MVRGELSVATYVKRVRLKVRLKPGLYRVTVRAILADGKRSDPEHAFLRVLKRR